MQKIINRVLLLLVTILILVLAFRTSRPAEPVVTSSITVMEENKLSDNEQKEKVELIVKEYLLNNPEVIVSSIEKIQQKKMLEIEEKVGAYIKEKAPELENSSDSPVLGNVNGDQTIIEFFDYNCSYCKRGDSHIEELIAKDPNVKVVLKPFPILGEMSNYAAKIALSVNKLYPDKFKAIHKALIKMKPITKEEVEKILVANELKVSEIEEMAASGAMAEVIGQNYDLAGNLRIKGAPAYIIGGKLRPGLLEVSEMEKFLKEARDTTPNTPKP